MKDSHGLIVNGCVEHKIVQCVLPQFQLMAERVGLFHWDDRLDGDSRLFKLAHLLMKIIPVELEEMHICYTNLKASPSAEVGCFIKQLLETSPEVLREYLIHLQEHMVTVITASTSGARNIHVMIDFLLIIVTDMPKDFIRQDKLFYLMARIGALIRETSTLIHDLEEKSRSGESTDETSRATQDLLKNIELLKEDVKYVSLKAPDLCQWSFPMSDGQLFMHLLHRHSTDLLDSDAYSISCIKVEIELVREDLKFMRSFFVNVEKRLYKDLWARLLDAAYEAKHVIDSIIVRDNCFKEETNWLISKLTSGPKDLDVISITGMPGSGKTTLAYKVYNDESVCSNFDIRAWCTVNQEYDEKKLLVKLFNQVTGSDLRFRVDIDVADKLRRQLFGKRYLIVLDDMWDTTTWDDLTRPFPDVEKGSRIILTTRQKEVAFHGKVNTDPLNLRLLSPEECWELLEKRAFGEQSCADELLDVGKEIAENCKGLPLVADLIAGVIAGREKTKSVWLEVRNNL
ncbi:putative late blight resistance protein homolog R1B-16, partial [Capsicum annuum]|uniref:putative late blight resistance protein homolog R1B-16 n=1 Tax=Capsicum annuum TaxID=4072 RepID=UPI001FB07824